MSKVCAKCGESDRFPSGGCRACSKKRYTSTAAEKIAYVTEWRKNNPERVRVYSAKWRNAHPEKASSAVSAWKDRNHERVKQKNKQWGEANSARKATTSLAWRVANPERTAFLVAEWGRQNSARRSEITAKRRSARMLRTTQWSDYDAIRHIYEQAKTLGMHVDHIIPLQGDNVSGLHVEYNLQLLTPEENKKKGNRFDPDLYVHKVPA